MKCLHLLLFMVLVVPVTLFEKNIPAFENVANIDQLPVKGFSVIALPMKIKGGSGGPLRIVALL
jgi:kynurenine formamidase